MSRRRERLSTQALVYRAIAARPIKVPALAKRLHITERQVRTAIDRLRAAGEHIVNNAPLTFTLRA